MLFSKFTIEHYRSFAEKQELVFAQPTEGKLGSGLTYLVGENNAGKTTVVEGLMQKAGKRIRRSEMPPSGSPVFTLTDEGGELLRKVKLIRNISYTLTEDPRIENQNLFEVVPARRHWRANVTNSSNYASMVQQISRASEPRHHDTSGEAHVSGLLKSIEEEDDKYSDFIVLIKEVLPEFNSYAIAYEEDEYVEYTTSNGLKHKSDFLGDGVISIIRILAHLFADNQNLLIIDEPELSLHPLAQRRLYKIIARYAETRQILIATHSPHFISWDHIKNGAQLNKVTKHNDGKSEIHSMSDYANYANLVNGANWQQPFLMDVVAKEIFFHDNFLFVEGQEDVGLLRSDGVLNDRINMFGYGVRGRDAFRFALQLAKDLGVRKAAVILDAGEEENKICSDLSAQFTDYKIVQWNKNDIRDKKPKALPQKEGYFTEEGEKKQTKDLDDYPVKVAEINTYFTGSQNL